MKLSSYRAVLAFLVLCGAIVMVSWDYISVRKGDLKIIQDDVREKQGRRDEDMETMMDELEGLISRLKGSLGQSESTSESKLVTLKVHEPLLQFMAKFPLLGLASATDIRQVLDMPGLLNRLRQTGYNKRAELYIHFLKNIVTFRNNRTLWENLDIMHLSPFKFQAEFRNPCWWSTKELRSNGCFQHYVRQPRDIRPTLRCLPYFLLIGQAKSGTTDLWAKFTSHPDVSTYVKETQWFCRGRIGSEESCTSIDAYIDHFSLSTSVIAQHHTTGSFNKYITGEGTPGYFSNNDFWDLLPGNEGCTEPCVTNAENVHHIVPGAKLILTLRNPTDRLYSLYFHKNGILEMEGSREEFHDLVTQEIAKYKECFETRTVRACCYDYQLSDSLTERIDIRRSIYHVYLEDWLKLFPREQLHVLRFEDYAANSTKELADIFKFLNLRELSFSEMSKITSGSIKNHRSTDAKHVGDMLNSTRELLNEFYEPFNKKLADLLQDPNYLW